MTSAHRQIHATPDTERVLGQIERGELRCGPDAAREIAARHQAAYGNDVWGSDDDSTWAAPATTLKGAA